MHVSIIPCNSDNYAYLLIDPDRRAVVVDPSDAAAVDERVRSEDVTLQEVWLTHHHLDHTAGIESLRRTHGALEIVGSAHDRQQGRIAGQTRGLQSGDRYGFLGNQVEIISVPGHTMGCVAYLVDGCLFCGDTLFVAGCGRVFEGTMQAMQQSLSRLRDLDGDTRIYCGHEYTVKNLEFALTVEPDSAAVNEQIAWARDRRGRGEPTVGTTMADELGYNPFLRWDRPPVMAAARELGAKSDEPAEVFAAVRRAKDRF
jgi:hydroxyacylglutathione hydrolase